MTATPANQRDSPLDAPSQPSPARVKIGFVSLGCPKNLVDSEVMMGLLHRAGAELTPRAEDADVLVVNTCSFIDSAKQESVDTVLEMVNHKVAHGGRAQRLIVAGCLVERYRDEIRANIPEVDAVVGTGELESILEAAGLTRPTPPPFPVEINAKSDSPFTVLTSVQVAHLEAGEQIRRAPSAVHQHSRPGPDGPQLRHPAPGEMSTRPGSSRRVDGVEKPVGLAAPYAEGLTLTGGPAPTDTSPVADTSQVAGTSPVAGTASPTAALSPGRVGDSTLTARPEGDARERAGRFSREGWDGASLALPTYLYSEDTPRILTTPRASAYIKIAEGCDHPCTFCIIPQLRGKFRSRPIASIVAEAKSLIAQGVREITLIGQDTTCYGEDLPPQSLSDPQSPPSLPSRPEREPQALSSRPESEPQNLPSRPEREPQALSSRPESEPQNLSSRPEREPQNLSSRPESEPQNLSSRPEREPQNLSSRPERSGVEGPASSSTEEAPSSTLYPSPDAQSRRRPELADLLDALAPLPGLTWLRFLYAYPNKVTTRLLETIARHENIANYLDLPLQHASASVLRRMKRGGSADRFLQILAKARALVPGVVLRTSFIVGFPGETEADFEELCRFVEAARFDWLGVFSYSDEEGAQAFDHGDKVPRRTIEARRRKLMRLQNKISRRSRKDWIGREVDLLVEGPSEETDLLWQGRTLEQAPEIDGVTLINDFGPHESLVPGTFYRAAITESHDYDVVARILE